MRLYKVFVKSIIVYACETWPTSKKDKRKLAVLEKKIVQSIFGPKKNDCNLISYRILLYFSFIFVFTGL